MRNYKEKAKHFINQETQFHLGMLPSEQSNPKTKGLDINFKKSLQEGVWQLQSVDRDIVPMAKKIFASREFSKLIDGIVKAIETNKRVIISGCGATGRLSIMLESCWRKFWQRFKANYPELHKKFSRLENQFFSIMTGGDYALVRSVEFFEDYMEFGRQQTKELNVGAGDCLIAINEGGETSSVYGSVDQALKSGADVFLLFNNPTDILCKYIERARKVLEDERVTKLDLFCGSMAIAGSTRMQATTSELLVIGTAMEEALLRILSSKLSESELQSMGFKVISDRSRDFTGLLDDLGKEDSLKAIADFILLEEKIYSEGGMVTYYADELLLDIFTDTTERAPTFMLPPFKKCDDKVSPPSWAFVKNPVYPTRDTWLRVYGRPPRCLDWKTPLYYKMGAPAGIAENPPLIYEEELYKFIVGNEEDKSRFCHPCAALSVHLSSETLGSAYSRFMAEFDRIAVEFDISRRIIIGEKSKNNGDIVIPVKVAETPLTIMQRLAAKLVLNTLSTGTMTRLGRVKSNWMSWVETSNKKLIDRSIRLVKELADVDYKKACYELFKSFEELESTDFAGKEKPSPAQYTIRRILESKK